MTWCSRSPPPIILHAVPPITLPGRCLCCSTADRTYSSVMSVKSIHLRNCCRSSLLLLSLGPRSHKLMDARNRSTRSLLLRWFIPCKFFTAVECDGVTFTLVCSQQPSYYTSYTTGRFLRYALPL